MASLLSDADKLTLGNVFQDIHDTFSRNITIFKTPERIIVSSTPDYNFFYGNSQEAIDIEYNSVSKVFPARIYWEPFRRVNDSVDDNIPAKIPETYCRLKLRLDALEFIEGYKEFWVDGKKLFIEGSTRPHGLFAIDFYDLLLKQTL